jgi:hypothetical protein
MNQDATRVRHLILWNRFWLILMVLGCLAWFANWQISGFFTNFERLRVSWQPDGSLTVSSMSDGPFVITHLVKSQIYVSDTDVGQAVQKYEETGIAQLQRPLVIVESGWVGLSKAEFDKLNWFGRSSGEPVAPPRKGSGVQIEVLYYKSRKTQPVN